jgi:hypothetical protein
LASTRESYRRANAFFDQGDPFTAYLYLFVAFNNLYCLLADFDGTEREKIDRALERIPTSVLRALYTPDFVDRVLELNGSTTEQFVSGPDSGTEVPGIINMKDYFLGRPAAECIAHVEVVADSSASDSDKLKTIQAVADSLLYTIRNNQFHAVKGAHRITDQRTLIAAYHLLRPLVDALLPLGDQASA